MKKNSSILKSMLTLFCVSTMLFSFTNTNDTTMKTQATLVDVNAADASLAPFKVMLVKHKVADYEKWKPAYVAHGSARKTYGLTDLDLLRGIDNPNEILLIEKITDVKKAKDFTMAPDLKETMEKAGVISQPEFFYYDVLRDDDSKINTKDRVIITHRVKDFDAWLKVFDSEGKATRAAEGMVDRALARGIDDPNIVHIVLAVTDMAKAKEAIYSEGKKKLMTSAGVEGPPTIEFFRQAK